MGSARYGVLTRWACSFLVAALLAFPSQSPRAAEDADDHDRARRALEYGEVLPLRTLLDRLARDMPGRVLEVELEREGGRWVYEVKLLRNGGVLTKLWLDARDGTVISRRGDHRPEKH